MITYSNLGKPRSGNLGNNLFQIASLLGIAHRYNTEFAIPTGWRFESCFALSGLTIQDISPTICIKEPSFNYCIDYFDKEHSVISNEVVDFFGWFQSEKYWVQSKPSVKQSLIFAEWVEKKTLPMQKMISQSSVAVSVRRGDYVTNPNFELLPSDFYNRAINKYFPNSSVFIFSDDFVWCNMNIIATQKVLFMDMFSPIEQLCLMSKFRNFVIANSTFSWWGAYLADCPKTVVRPNYHFAGEKLKKHDWSDYYPADWIVFDHRL